MGINFPKLCRAAKPSRADRLEMEFDCCLDFADELLRHVGIFLCKEAARPFVQA